MSCASRSVVVVALGVAACSAPEAPRHDGAGAGGVARFVDPFIGTAGDGNVYPGATAPWGWCR